MILGITPFGNEARRAYVLRRLRLVTIVGALVVALPILFLLAVKFQFIHGRASFATEIQEPVAKVVTPNGTGTAFLVSPTQLLTARHVVEGQKIGDKVDLFFEQHSSHKQLEGTISYIAPSGPATNQPTVTLDYFLNDVAVLTVEEVTDIEPLILGESDQVSNLDEVILIGYPGGDYAITKGNINNIEFQGRDLFKLDATSNPGNSGGPCVLKDDNTVIGILVGGSGSELQGENVALKINSVKRILDQAGQPLLMK